MTEKQKTYLQSSVLKTIQQIDLMPPAVAAAKIEQIADKKGDPAAAKIVDLISPVKLAAMLRENDFSCPAAINWLITPVMISRILKVEPLFWRDVPNLERIETFLKIRDHILEMILSLLLSGKDPDRQEAIIENIFDDDQSRDCLLLSFVDQEDLPNRTGLFDDPETEIGTSEHLYEIVRKLVPGAAEHIVDFVCSQKTTLTFFINDLWMEAFSQIEQGESSTIEKTMFIPIRKRS